VAQGSGPPQDGEAQAPDDRDTAAQAAPPPNDPYNDQYRDRVKNYQAQMQQYRDDRANYRTAQNAYAQNLRDYDQAQYAWDYPAPVTYHYSADYGLRPLNRIAEPSQQLSRAPVEGPNGRWVGRVRNIEIGPAGSPAKIEVALNRRVSVWVSAGHLRFDPQTRILYTDMSRQELWGMPGATVESDQM
jgi:hypothetical protein